MNAQQLRNAIDAVDKINDADWRSSLSPRKRKELEFHDRDRDSATVSRRITENSYDDFYGNKKYYSTVTRSTEYVDSWIRIHSPGKIFLDYACGNGANAIKAANAGAALSVGFDISSVSVRASKNSALRLDLKNTKFFQADAEDTRLPESCVDTILCSGMLHHLDLSFALPEMRRLLKPGGRALAVEALNYNPAIKLYRLLTPKMRTEWESTHILSLRDLDFAERFFSIGEVRFWHVTGYIGAKITALRKPLDLLDTMLEKIPVVQRLSWIFTFELIKNSE